MKFFITWDLVSFSFIYKSLKYCKNISVFTSKFFFSPLCDYKQLLSDAITLTLFSFLLLFPFLFLKCTLIRVKILTIYCHLKKNLKTH